MNNVSFDKTRNFRDMGGHTAMDGKKVRNGIFYRSSGRMLMHDETRKELGYLLTVLAVRGEEEALSYIRHHYMKDDPIPDTYREYENLEEFNRRLEAGEVRL